MECAAKFPDKKSFVVAAILRATGGGRMALCMEDPAHWPAQRQDYQHNCLVWVCTLPSLHVVQPEEGVSPENVSMLCRAINSLRKGGTRHLSTFSLPRETKQVLFPTLKKTALLHCVLLHRVRHLVMLHSWVRHTSKKSRIYKQRRRLRRTPKC